VSGEPEKAYGEAWFGPSGTDWVFTGTLRFPDNVIAVFDCGTAMPERDELEAIGSEGSVFLDDPWHCNVPVIELRTDGKVERIELEPVDSYRLELENLSAAMVEIDVPPRYRRRGVGASLWDWATHRAAGAGRTIFQTEINVPARESLETWPGARFARSCR